MRTQVRFTTTPFYNTEMFLGLSAAISSVLTNVFMTPLDTIRARYQLSTKKLSVSYVIKELWSNEGYKGFYKGEIDGNFGSQDGGPQKNPSAG